MFPIRDHNPSRQTPVVTYLLMAANIGIFMLTWPAFGDPELLSRIFGTYALIPARLGTGDGLYTLVTSAFLHGGLLHLAGNMLFLWIFGDNMEEAFGRIGFLVFYLACGIGAGLAQVVSAPWSPIPTVGASGAIAGVMGGYLLLFPRAKVDVLFIFIIFFKIIPVPAWLMLGVWFALQLFSSVGADPMSGGVAYWAHAGGFVLGALFTLPLLLRRGAARYWSRTHGRPEHPPARYRASPVPRVTRRR